MIVAGPKIQGMSAWAVETASTLKSSEPEPKNANAPPTKNTVAPPTIKEATGALVWEKGQIDSVGEEVFNNNMRRLDEVLKDGPEPPPPALSIPFTPKDEWKKQAKAATLEPDKMGVAADTESNVTSPPKIGGVAAPKIQATFAGTVETASAPNLSEPEAYNATASPVPNTASPLTTKTAKASPTARVVAAPATITPATIPQVEVAAVKVEV